MSAPVSRQVNIYINQASAERAYANLEKSASKLQEQIDKGAKAGKDMTAELDKLGDTKKKMEQLEGVISGRLQPSMKQVRARVSELRRELDGMSTDTEEYREKLAIFDQASAKLREMKAAASGVGDAMKGLKEEVKSGSNIWDTIKGVAIGTIVGNTVQAATETIAGYFSSIISGNAKLSDSLADVRKATGLTVPEVEALNAALSKIDTRTSHEELRKIAIGLGQIGEAATPETVAAIDKIVVALGDEFGGGAQEITTTLGTLRNNLQDIKTGNYAEDMLHIGNALNQLGAEGLATAPVVVDFANRLAGIASTFGASSGQILGLSAALQEVGVPAERGATAVTKLLQKLTSETDKYAGVAKYAGITTQDFVKLVNTDIIAALTKFAEGARKAGTDNQTFGKILKDLDADGSGTGEVLSKLAKNAGLLSGKIDLASKSLKESGSITAEFDGKNNNLAATLEKIEKKMASAFANSTILNGLKKLVGGFAELIGAVDHSHDALDAFREQQTRINNLEKNILPLITRYDELTKKAGELGGATQLSKDEQVDLNKAIAIISSTIPGAITQFDNYGRAIGLSSSSAREFIRVQKLVLAERNRDAISEQASLQQRLESEKKSEELRLQHAVEARKKAGNPFTLLPGATADQRKAFELLDKKYRKDQDDLDAAITHYQVKIGDFANRIAGIQGILKELKGEPLVEDSERQDDTHANGKSDYTSAADAKAAAKAEKAAERAAKAEELKQKKAKKQLERNFQDLQDYAEEQAKRALQEQQKYYERDRQESADYFGRQRQAANESYANGTDDLKTYEASIKAIDQAEKDDRIRVDAAHADLVAAAAKKLEEAKTAALEQGVAERTAADKRAKDATIDQLRADVAATRNGSVAQLEAKRALLAAEYKLSVEAAKAKGEATKRIDAEYNQQDAALQLDVLRAKVQANAQHASTVRDILGNIYSFQSTRDQDVLDRDRALNDEKKKNLQKQLDAGRISRSSYDRQIEQLDDDYARKQKEARIKAFNRDKQIALLTAAINTATAVTEALPNYFLAAAVAASGLIQVGLIAGKKPPEYAKGGVTRGARHADGGISLINANGQKVGEMEGGEAYMILSRETTKNNASVINDLLAASMYGGGRPIQPRYLYSQPAAVNYAGATENVSYARRFAAGGILNRSGLRRPEAADGGRAALPAEVVDLLYNLNEKLDKGFQGHVYWNEIDKKNQQAASLKKAASLGALS